MCTRFPNQGMYTAKILGHELGACRFCLSGACVPGEVHPTPTIKHAIASANTRFDKRWLHVSTVQVQIRCERKRGGWRGRTAQNCCTDWSWRITQRSAPGVISTT